jgi:hypothetical protein
LAAATRVASGARAISQVCSGALLAERRGEENRTMTDKKTVKRTPRVVSSRDLMKVAGGAPALPPRFHAPREALGFVPRGPTTTPSVTHPHRPILGFLPSHGHPVLGFLPKKS